MKKILLVVGAVLLCVVLGITVPKYMNDGTQGMAVDVDVLQQRFEQELIASLDQQMEELAIRQKYEAAYDAMIANQRADTEMDSNGHESENNSSATTNDVVNDHENAEELFDETDSPLLLEGVEEPNAIASTNKEVVDTGSPSENPDKVEAVITKEEQIVKDQWVQEKISANRDEIADEDLYSGAEIYNLLDTGYLFELAEDGLTEEERIEVEAYLRSVLNDEQLALALELYSKYVHLVN